MPRRRVRDRRARGGVPRDAAAAALREEPVERGGVSVGAVPGVVSDAGVFVQFRERAAGGADGVDHRARAEGRDDAVGQAVERADRHGDEAGGEVRVAAAADGDGRREEAGAALQQVPDAVAAHRDAGRVDAVGVDGERGEAVVQQLHRERERLGGALRHRVREGAPRRVDPLLPAGALRRHQDERQLPFPPPGEELAAAVHELQAVVRPALARAVQQEDERDALAVAQVGRDVLPVGERRAGGVREDERLRRGGGLVHRERRADLRPLFRAFGGDGLACARGQGREGDDERRERVGKEGEAFHFRGGGGVKGSGWWLVAGAASAGCRGFAARGQEGSRSLSRRLVILRGGYCNLVIPVLAIRCGFRKTRRSCSRRRRTTAGRCRGE